MQRNGGFSIAEVLVSLLLIMGLSLALLKQQWQVNQWLHQLYSRFDTMIQHDNDMELKERGFSLIELCISLFLISCIMTGLMQHYVQVKRQYQWTEKRIEDIAEVQWVTELMRMSIRKAGFTPCLPIHHLETSDQRGDQVRLTALTTTNNRLSVNRMSDQFLLVSTTPHGRDIQTASHTVLPKNQPILIADCYHAEVRHIELTEQTSHGQWIRLQHPLFFTYRSPVYIGPWLEESFFINNKGSLAYSAQHPEELTSLVNGMSVHQQQFAGHTYVSITLNLRDGKTQTLETMARMS